MKKFLSWVLIVACVLAALPTLIGCKKTANVYTRYEITAEFVPESKTVAGTVKVNFENPTDNEISVLKFQLYPNAYRKNALYSPISTTYETSAYYQGESYGEIVISSVNGSKNWEVMGEDENILYVDLQSPLYPGDEVVLDIGFITKLANVNHRTGVTAKTVNLGNFFPILCGIKKDGFVETAYYSDGDPFYSDCAEFKVRLTLPKEYTVASSGKMMEERTLESKKVYTMYEKNVRDFTFVLSKHFQVLSAVENGKTLSYYYYTDETPQKTLDAIQESFSFFEKTFGEYPYEHYAVAETGFCFGGMEYPCLSFLSDGLKQEGRVRAVVHETAHQWWYGVVGSDQIEEAWQDEGLAEYSAIAFFEEYEKYEFSREEILKEAMTEYRSYYDVYGSVLGRSDTRMSRHLKEYLSDYEYRCLAYDKSVIMFDTLRKSVGDKKFFSSLKKYYSGNLYRMTTSGDLIAAFEKNGLDVGGFFDSFLNGKAVL